MFVYVYIYCFKKLREHFDHTSDLDELSIQVENLYS